MTWFATRGRLSRAAFSPQRWRLRRRSGAGGPSPGTSAGTASSLTQLVMAFMVYGTSALVIGGRPDRRAYEARQALRFHKNIENTPCK